MLCLFIGHLIILSMVRNQLWKVDVQQLSRVVIYLYVLFNFTVQKYTLLNE